MLLYKFKTKSIDLHITDGKIPSLDEFGKVPGIKDIQESWWTSEYINTPREPYRAFFAQGNTYSYTRNLREVRGILPIVFFNYGSTASPSDKLDIGDEFIINNTVFRVVDKDAAICRVVIGYTPYGHKGEKQPSFYYSILKQNSDNWVKHLKNKPVDKILSKTQHVVYASNFRFYLPTIDDPTYSLPNIPCWLRGRKDEFTGYCQNGQTLIKTAINRNNIDGNCINICPMMYLKLYSDISLNEYETVAIAGRLFKTVSIDNNLAKLLCLNPIGTSCYSTGICEKGNEIEEHVFYLNSEAHEVIKNWVSTL